MITLGAQLFSLRKFIQTAEGIESTFQKMAEMGYENVQLSSAANIGAKNFARISRDTGLPIVCTHSNPDKIVNNTEALIEEHLIMECPVIGIGAIPGAPSGDMEAVRAYLDKLAPAVEKIEKAGLNFAYHNHAFEFTLPGDDGKCFYDTLIDNNPTWHFILDTYWIQKGGFKPEDYMRKIGAGRLNNIHFKDMANDEARSICACGEGILDFPAIYEVCKELAVQHILVEQDNAIDREDPFGEMKKSFLHLRPIIC